MDEVAAKVEALKDEMVKNRRFFHSHPETGFFTFFTTAKIASELKKLGYSLKMGREIMKPEARAGLGSKKDKEKYNALGEESIIQTSELKKDIHDLVEDENS